jgi:hypothetical protein
MHDLNYEFKPGELVQILGRPRCIPASLCLQFYDIVYRSKKTSEENIFLLKVIGSKITIPECSIGTVIEKFIIPGDFVGNTIHYYILVLGQILVVRKCYIFEYPEYNLYPHTNRVNENA